MNMVGVLILCSILSCSITCFVALDYLQMSSNEQLPRKKYIVILLCSSLFIGVIGTYAFPVFKTMGMMLLCMGLGKLCFQHHAKELLQDFFFAILICMVDFVMIPILLYLFWNLEITPYMNLFLNGLLMLLSQILLLYIYHIFRKIYFHDEYDAPTGLRILSFIGMPLYSVINIVLLVSMSQYLLHEVTLLVYVGNIIFIVFLNLYQFYAMHTMSLNSRMSQELALYEQKNEMQLAYYELLEESYQRSREVIHDMNRHFQAIQGAKSQQLPTAEYEQDFKDRMNSFAMPLLSTHRLLNIILNDKKQMAEKAEIEFHCELPPLSLDFIKDIDLTTIFANLLDNALDACKKCEGKRYISICGDSIQDFLVVSIENKMPLLPFKKNQVGIGLRNVEQALNKYGGNMQVTREEEKFMVNLYIPVK